MTQLALFEPVARRHGAPEDALALVRVVETLPEAMLRAGDLVDMASTIPRANS